jgi:hypothetical protein
VTRHALVLFGLIALMSASNAHAQSGPPEGGPDPAKVRVRIGPLMMSPTVSLTNLGIDQNVFNEPPDKNPKRDFTFTVTPMTDVWLRIGRTWLTGKLIEDVVWYQKYASERSASNRYALGWRAPLTRVSLSTNLEYERPKERPGYEIDARVQRRELNTYGSAEIRMLSKTLIGVSARRQSTAFAGDATFRGVNLQQQLTFVTTGYGVSVRQQLTPLTSVSLDMTRSRDRFKYLPDRDSESSTFDANIAFNALAAIKGGASIGFRDFKPLDLNLPEFKGTIGSADLTFTLLGATRFSLKASRDVEYSYDVNQPYYLATGADGSIAQQIFGPVDVVARIGFHKLAYRDRGGALVNVSNRVDHTRLYGAGVGYHMGKDLRLGFNVDKVRRESELADRRYDNLKLGTAITYGF